jgi:Na+/H+ antiporter NhaD/arsenite permease-like protein
MQLVAAIIILLTYAGVALGQVPGLRMNRATIALVGAAALVATGVITEQQAFAALDIGTLLLLAAMMIINLNLRIGGFFNLVADRALRIARTPRTLLALLVISAGAGSALFLNDTICLLMTPLVVELTLRLKRNPVPYLIGLATAANIGSTATIIGNPQNLVIGRASGIRFLTFAVHLVPVALIGLAICWVVIVLTYPAEFRGHLDTVEMPEPWVYRPLLRRSILIVLGLLLVLLAGFPIASSACIAAGFFLISRLRPVKLLAIDWPVLAFFSGLFVVTGAIEVTGLGERLFSWLSPVIHGGVVPLSIATAVLSNLISNVPAVLLFRSEIAALANSQQAWLTLAMSSTLAGNLTLLGSVANLIVAELAAQRGVRVSFRAYLRAGLPITLLTILFGILWLTLTHE